MSLYMVIWSTRFLIFWQTRPSNFPKSGFSICSHSQFWILGGGSWYETNHSVSQSLHNWSFEKRLIVKICPFCGRNNKSQLTMWDLLVLWKFHKFNQGTVSSCSDPLFKSVKRLERSMEREEKGWKAWQRWRGLAGQAPIFIKTPAKQPPVLSLKANYREKVVKDCCWNGSNGCSKSRRWKGLWSTEF